MDKVILQFEPQSYAFLNKTIDELKSFVHILGVHDPIKKALLTDIKKITITLDNAKNGGNNESLTSGNFKMGKDNGSSINSGVVS